MEFFKFNYDTYPTQLEAGEIINNLSSSMWVERYSEPGEFSLDAQLSSGLREFLPVGTLISHADTLEVMIVENHVIKESQDEDPTISATGRSFTSFLENRIIGMNAARVAPTLNPYLLNPEYTWNQIVKILLDHIVSPYAANDALINVGAVSTVTGTSIAEARSIDYGSVWKAVSDLLAIDDLGIKTVRRNTFGVVGSSTQTLLTVYKGIDKSASVIFSWKGGDISSADYLFTLKNLKNSAFVKSKYFVVPVDISGFIQYNRRMMMVDASDVDEHFQTVPTGTDLTNVMAALNVRGRQALAKQGSITINQTDVSKTSKYLYRNDYNMGDLISIDGDFGQIAIMRVTEYAEIEDENGESGHPTLSIPGG